MELMALYIIFLIANFSRDTYESHMKIRKKSVISKQ